MLIIKDLCTSNTEEIAPATYKDIEKPTRNLNSGKAMDCCGITAEHFKYACDIMTPFITALIGSYTYKEFDVTYSSSSWKCTTTP